MANDKDNTITVTCSRSGLSFQAENKRKKVHPAISEWTTCKDWETRKTASSVIERGKIEGWDSIEKFEEEIQKAFEPVPESKVFYNLTASSTGSEAASWGQPKKAWVAKITGQSEKYGYEREFIEPVKIEGREYFFNLIEDGVYQSCSFSGKGNKYENWHQVKDGKLISLSDSEAIAIVGQSAERQLLSSSDELFKVVEECWECGATYTTYGNVDSGNMGCRRCN